MDSTGGSHFGEDHTDHAYPFKNEVSLSIGGDDSTSSPAKLTPTPSPRMYGKSTTPSADSDHHSDDSRSTHVPSPSSSKDSAVLMRRSGGDEPSRAAGLDNPGFETDASTPARPLSSFGGGSGHPTNGTPINGKPVTGELTKFY